MHKHPRLPFNPLVRFDIAAASSECLRIAAGQERAGMKAASEHWLNLAKEIEAGRYLDQKQIADLVLKVPFIRTFVR